MILGDIYARNAAHHPDGLAYSWNRVNRTHSAFLERAGRLACALHDHGLRSQARVAILAQNRGEYLEAYGATETAGFIAVPLNWRLADAELAPILKDCQPQALVFEAQYAARAAALREALEPGAALICIGSGAPEWACDYEVFLAGASAVNPPCRATPDDTAHIIYTSGTTGRPKGVMLGQRGQVLMAERMSAEGGVQQTDRHLMVMPLFHSGAKCKHLIYAWRGAAIFIRSAWDPDEVLGDIAEHGITDLHLAPVMVRMLLDAPGFAAADLARVKTVYYASAPMPSVLLRRALDAFGPALIQFYGSTEAPLATVLQKHQHLAGPGAERRLGSAGQAFIGTDVRVVDPKSRSLPPGEAGEVMIRSGALMQGYWNNHVATAETLRDGWLHTGDLGWLDHEGFLTIADRKKDMIISGGENIYPREVEEVLASHPGVREAAVIGVPDEVWGEAVKAFVVPKEGSAPAAVELIEHCRDRLAAYKKPKSVELVEDLPRVSTGKVDRKALREPYWAGQQRRVN